MSTLMDDNVRGGFYTRNFQKGAGKDSLILNLGPQHPSTHGVLRVLLELDGEYVLRAEPVLGYLHRMHEKMAEVKTPMQFIPNMGRVDYLHPLAWNWAYAGAVERLAGIEVPERAEYLRVITTELNRLSSHLVWWGTYILDLGAFTPILYAFDDREELLDILQMLTGSRLTYSYFRFGGVCRDAPPEFFSRVRAFVPRLRKRMKMYKALVTDNMILLGRVDGIGPIPAEMCGRYGATGPTIRAAGVAYDVRRSEPYSIYDRFDFDIPVEQSSCSLGRYLVRIAEMEQSLRIIEQAVESIPDGPVLPAKPAKHNFKLPPGEASFAVEGARGKVKVWIASDGGKTPYRIKLRSPSLSNLSAFPEAAQGTLIADTVVIIGSLDLVIPELDR